MASAALRIAEPDTVPVENAVALALPDDIAFADWIDVGRDLISRHRNTEWMLADWLKVGAEKFHDEAQFGLFLGELGVDVKDALSDAKVARLIPSTWRSDKVSFEVCKQIAKIEDEAVRQRMIKQAVDEHWNSKVASHAVVQHKVETGQLFEDDDAVSRFATEIIRQWNRMPIDAREYAFPLIEIAAASGFGPIDEDAAI